MALDTPTGEISLMQEFVKDQFAESAALQTLFGVANSAAAKAKIHFKKLPPPAANADEYAVNELANFAPYALYWMDYANGFLLAKDASLGFERTGRVMVEIVVKSDPEDEDTANDNRKFENALGAIIDDVLALVLTAGFFAFNRIEVVEGPYHNTINDQPTQGHIIGARLLLSE